MTFTSFTYFIFFIGILICYWSLGWKKQNVLLLIGSFVFYGWVTPWFCLLLGTSIVVDYFCGLAIAKPNASVQNRKGYLALSVCVNIGMLAVFKYFNFFIENVIEFLSLFHFQPSINVLSIALPVGISFYTFQTLSYTIDIYRGRIQPTRDFVGFAVFVSLFPQLVAGPIERARNMLPQILNPRKLSSPDLTRGFYLIMRGLVKKMVVADNVAIYVDKIFALETADPLMVATGSVGFGIQIYADFSAYTDIARGSARLMGFHLMENFKSPYLAWSPSDFWRRWHISLSTWIRDYLYIPLGGSKSGSRLKLLSVLIITMGLSGLWHGAAWNFVAWGLYHGLLLVIYHVLGFGGKWEPGSILGKSFAIGVMLILTMVGWSLFRTPSLEWLFVSLFGSQAFVTTDSINNAVYIAVLFALYSVPLLLYRIPLDKIRIQSVWIFVCVVIPLVLIEIFHRDAADDFIYFQF